LKPDTVQRNPTMHNRNRLKLGLFGIGLLACTPTSHQL